MVPIIIAMIMIIETIYRYTCALNLQLKQLCYKILIFVSSYSDKMSILFCNYILRITAG